MSEPAEKESRQWGMFCHLSPLLGFVIPIPFLNIIAPIVVWQLKKNDYPFVDEQGKEAVNFQITMTICAIVSAILILVIIGFFLLLAIVIFSIVQCVMAAVRANNGESYRYPLTLRLVK